MTPPPLPKDPEPDITAHDPTPTQPPPQIDAPEISRSAGVKGGFVLLWPRMIPRSKDSTMIDMASFVQQRLRQLSERAVNGAPIDIRPEPERVCPKPDGCVGTAVGALVLREKDGCAVLAVISAPGQSNQRVVPWVGSAKLKAESVPFREPPESIVRIDDWAPCSKVTDSLKDGEADVLAAIKAAHY
jgi:hypothetical protein